MKKEGEMGREMIKRDKNREIRWGKEREWRDVMYVLGQTLIPDLKS